MKKLFPVFTTIITLLILSFCLSSNQPISNSDIVILQTIFKKHPPPTFSVNEEPPNPGMTFDEFSKYLIYTREDVDINNDGKEEILLSGSTAIPTWAFFIAYTINGNNELQELYYSDAVGWYVANAQFKVELPYIFVDFLTTYGGTGFYSYGSERNIVRCKETNCDSISYRYFSGNTSGDYHVSSATVSENQVEIKVSGFYINTETIAETVCDPTGKEYSLNEERQRYYVDTNYYSKYLWKDNHFLETDRQETPAFEVSGFFDGTYTGIIPHLISKSVKPNSTMQQTLDTYFDFFDATTSERNHIQTIPCNQVREETDWLPYSIPTTVYDMGDEGYFASVNVSCKLVVWKKNSDIFEPSIKDLEIIGRENLTVCNPDFISFQWMNITGNDVPELIITSGIFKQTVWIYDVSEKLKLLHQATGVSRANPMIGAQVKKVNNDVVLQVGLPLDKGKCLDAFNCFQLDKDFEVFRWNNETQTFVSVP